MWQELLPTELSHQSRSQGFQLGTATPRNTCANVQQLSQGCTSTWWAFNRQESHQNRMTKTITSLSSPMVAMAMAMVHT